MKPRDYPPLVEAFLIIDQPRQRLSHWTQALAPLGDRSAPPPATITAYYDPSVDQALLGLRYDPITLGGGGLGFLVELALLAEIGMIQPAELSDADRKRFLGARLSSCTIHVSDQRTVVNALTELVRRVRAEKHVTRPPQIRAARGLPARGDTEDPHLLVHAKGTREGMRPTTDARSTRDLGTQNDLSEPIERPRPQDGHAASPHVVTRVHRAATVELDPAEARALVSASVAPPAVPQRGLAASQVMSEPYLPSPTNGEPPKVIYARYLRSGRWVPTRVAALSLKGASLMAGALPRMEDHVDIALAFGGHRALVRGSVGKVSSEVEVQASGASTFSVGFRLDHAAKRQLTALLTAARTARVTIKPPPARNARRYPVDWPVCIGTSRGAVRAEALDVSREGMFVKPQHALAVASAVKFSAVLDDADAVSGIARVVREIGEPEARSCGLAPGFGIQITDMSEDDRARWLAFLTRVEHRAGKRVLIGAAPGRLAELQASLTAAGYAVTGGTDPGSLVQLASAGGRPVDAALIDAQWLTAGMTPAWVEALFSARNVPCVTLHGDVRRARTALDKLLAVDGGSQRG